MTPNDATSALKDLLEPPHAAVALQHGMSTARKIIWKHMSNSSRAKYFLRKMVESLRPKQ